jgi:hypothetical protein
VVHLRSLPVLLDRLGTHLDGLDWTSESDSALDAGACVGAGGSGWCCGGIWGWGRGGIYRGEEAGLEISVPEMDSVAELGRKTVGDLRRGFINALGAGGGWVLFGLRLRLADAAA